MAEAVDPDRYARDELHVFQHRSIRRWKEDAWAGEHRPSAVQALDDADDQRIWLDLTDSDRPAEQMVGAVVVGLGFGSLVDPSPYERQPDIQWSISQGIPANARAVDRLTIAVDRLPPAAQMERVLPEIRRVLDLGGSVTFRGRGRSEWAARLAEDPDFSIEGSDPLTLTRMRSVVSLADAGPPNVREVVLGEALPERVRRLRGPSLG